VLNLVGSNITVSNNLIVVGNSILGSVSNVGNMSVGSNLNIGGKIVLNNDGIIYSSNGFIGIGRSNPISALDVLGDINFSGMLRSNGAAYVSSQWSNTGSTIFIMGSNVAIGKSNASYPLDIVGDLNFTGTLRQNNLPYVGSQWSNNGSNLWISGSNIGIGTAATTNVLTVGGGQSIGIDYTSILCPTNGLIVEGYTGICKSNPQFALDINGDINFTGTLMQNSVPYVGSQWSNSSSNVFITGSNIGIGYSNPLTALSVNGSGSFSGLISSTGIQIFQDNGSSSMSVSGSGSGNMVGYSNDSSGTILSIDGGTSNSSFRFVASNAEVLRVGGNGFIGINTINPQSMLHVNGNSLFSGQAVMLSNQTNPFMIVQNSVGTSLMGVATSATVFSTDSAPGDLVLKSFTGNKLIFQSGNVGNSLCINSNNCVGIANPAAAYPLDVIGNARFQGLIGTGNRSLYVDPNGILTINPSDSNLKQNINAITYGLNEVLGMNPITYYWTSNIQGRFGSQREVGLIAQEVAQIVPEIVHANRSGYLSLDYEKIVPILIKSIQELNEKIKILESKII
jgi:hypothetical protein